MVNKGGKHKRRDRGSPVEDLAMIKRANMAVIEVAEKEDSLTEKQLEMCQEPSLSDLKEMLVDIQISVNNSLFENKRIGGEVVVIKITVQNQKPKLAAIKEAAVRDQLVGKEEEKTELYDLQDCLEQYTRKNLLDFHRILESTYSLPKEVVQKLSEALEVSVNPRDIEIYHKLNNKGNKAINAKFASHKVKSVSSTN